MAEVRSFFEAQAARFREISSIGLGALGPIILGSDQASHETIVNSPKPDWNGFNIVGYLRSRICSNVAVKTDVAAAFLAELEYGAVRSMRSCAYIMVGTGTGAALTIDGKLIQGAMHSEIGHQWVRPLVEDDDFKGVCPYHGSTCFEGVASGRVMTVHWGKPSRDLSPDHPDWEFQAEYLARLVYNIFLISAPERIMLGGGVMA